MSQGHIMMRRTAVAVVASCAIIAAQVAALPYIANALFTHVVLGALFFAAPALPWLPALFGAGEGTR